MGDGGNVATAPAPRAPEPTVVAKPAAAAAAAKRPSKKDTANIPWAEPASPIGTRYTTERMARIFGWSNYIDALLKVEAAVSLSISELYPEKVTPEQAAKIAEVANVKIVTPEAVRKREAVTHHDIIALHKELAAQAGEAGGAVHFTLTSADVTESAKAMQFKQGLAVIINSAENARDALLDFAMSNRQRTAIMRTHGQHAIPASFGLPFAFFASSLQMSIKRLEYDLKNHVEGKISGAIGTYDTAADEGMDGRAIERNALSRLGIKPSEISTQVPAREGLAYIALDLAVLASRVESVAEYIKNLKRTEILEIQERPDEGTKGSSAMPHKDKYGNPHIEERLASIARSVRGFSLTLLESVHMQDFRDLTASFSDREAVPQAFTSVDYALELLENLARRIEVMPANVERNLMLTKGVVTAPRVMSRLFSKGMPRPQGRDLVSEAAKTMDGTRSFEDVLKGIPSIMAVLSEQELHELADPHTYIGESRKQVVAIARMYRGKRSPLGDIGKPALEDVVRA